MKTSLLIEDSLYEAAREEARRGGSSLSQVISEWARLGRMQAEKQKGAKSRRHLPTVDLGAPAQVDLSSRREWMEMLER